MMSVMNGMIMSLLCLIGFCENVYGSSIVVLYLCSPLIYFITGGLSHTVCNFIRHNFSAISIIPSKNTCNATSVHLSTTSVEVEVLSSEAFLLPSLKPTIIAIIICRYTGNPLCYSARLDSWLLDLSDSTMIILLLYLLTSKFLYACSRSVTNLI